MIGGTAKQRKCYPVHTTAQRLSQQIVENLLGFHALTGSDTTSAFTSFGKKKCWKIFEQHPHFRLYGATNPLAGVNKCRNDLFEKGKKDLEKLPPTKDAFDLHLARCNHQAKIWIQADKSWQNVGLPTETGAWNISECRLEVKWTTLPSTPMSCIDLVSCGCTKKCSSSACKCYKSEQRCTPVCGCDARDCRNPCGLFAIKLIL